MDKEPYSLADVAESAPGFIYDFMAAANIFEMRLVGSDGVARSYYNRAYKGPMTDEMKAKLEEAMGSGT